MNNSPEAPGQYRVRFAAPRPPADEPAGWVLTEQAFDPAQQAHAETILTAGNGQHCLRGSFEEGYPGQSPAGFMHRVWDDMPLALTELANLPQWHTIDLWIDGARFAMNQGKVSHYQRALDLRDGLLHRNLTWASLSGTVAELTFERFIDFSHPARAAVRMTIKTDRAAQIRTRCTLDARVENQGLIHFDTVRQGAGSDHAFLEVKTRATNTPVALISHVSLSGPTGTKSQALGTDADQAPATEHRFTAQAGATYHLTKYIAITNGLDGDQPLDAAWQVSADAAGLGWDHLVRSNIAAWREFWAGSDVVIEGDPEAQLALRHAIFQLAIAAPKWTDRASIGAKTLSGFGYHHHVFWDTDIFMLPLFTFTQPSLARHMLMYRWHCLAGSRAKAKAAGRAGAAFAWESAADGSETTPTWVIDPADRTKLVRIWTGDLEIHITADVAYAVMQYWRATQDESFVLDYGAEIVLDGASYWASMATPEPDNQFHLRNVVAADEYHDRVDDNAFTNLMARWHLRTALDLVKWLKTNHQRRWQQLATALDLTEDWLAQWQQAAERLASPAKNQEGVLEEFTGYFDLAEPDFNVMRSPERNRSMQDILGLEGVAKTQVVKQPDVLMAAYLLPELLDAEQLKANVEYYDPRTDHEHGSSLGPAISAIMARRAGQIDLAYQHFMRAARADLMDVRHNTDDGMHGASAGGLWQAVVFGFAGTYFDRAGNLDARPNLPSHWRKLEIGLTQRGQARCLVIERLTP